MNILILGSGGREHALAWKILQSQKCDNLFVAPGNSGTASIAINCEIQPNDFDRIAELVLDKQIEMVVVGTEDPLVRGIVDYFQENAQLNYVKVVGPSRYAAQLEGSKDFAKQFMKRHQIPTAAYNSFTAENLEDGLAFLEGMSPPYVLKADGLAAGKGVLILKDLETAKRELREMLTEAKFGEASNRVVIEEFLDGLELSCFVLTDGKTYKILPYAKDYKRIGEGDTGLNTGGMGAVSPVPFATEAFLEKVENRIVKPTIKGLNEENFTYKGFVFIGLIKVGDDPFVIEYNVRMGDPETEAVMLRLNNDLVVLLDSIFDGSLGNKEIQIDPHSACTIMLVSGGYPEAYEKGKTIHGLEEVRDSVVFHAGAKRSEKQIQTAGGRVLAVSSKGISWQDAVQTSYESIDKISFEKMYFRKDIGFDLQV